ncbi:MAG TPA: lipoprotein insertase outer membrane protein LolB, partial [Steroidobacteraceae bacterium]
MRSSALWLGAALIAVLAGCRTPPPAPAPGQSWEARRPQLQSLQHFVLRGRVAVAAGGEGFNASLRWTQEGNRTQVTLGGPLGVGGAQLTATGDDLTVITAR